MTNETEQIAKLLQRSFDKGGWHGPTVKEVISKIGANDASRSLPNSHSIIALVAHMTAWRRFVISRLKGDNTFTVTDELNFGVTGDWKQTVDELENTQQELLNEVSKFPIERLADLVPATSFKYTFYTMLHGIIHHDLYHIGQIVLINKSIPTPAR